MTTTTSTTLHPRLLWILTSGGFLSFFVFGFVDNLKGPILPDLLRDLSFSYSQGGGILFGAYVGFLVATLLTGILVDLIGNKMVLIIAGVCLSGGIVLFSSLSSWGALVTAMAVIGLGTGSIEVGANMLIVDLHQKQRGRYLNLLAVFHGIGSLLVPLYAAFLLQTGFIWRQVFRYSLGLTLLLALYFIALKYPAKPKQAGSGGLDWLTVRRTGFTSRMLWFYLLIMLYVAAELGLAAWLVEFLQQVKDFSVGQSSLYLSLFFGGLMIGRLFGSLVVERIGYVRVMLLAITGATLCLLIGIFGPPPLAFFLTLVGLFFSIIFPTTTAAVSELHRENTGTIFGLLFAFGGVGGAVGPWAIGLSSDWLGLQFGFALTIAYCLVAATALLVLGRLKIVA